MIILQELLEIHCASLDGHKSETAWNQHFVQSLVVSAKWNWLIL